MGAMITLRYRARMFAAKFPSGSNQWSSIPVGLCRQESARGFTGDNCYHSSPFGRYRIRFWQLVKLTYNTKEWQLKSTLMDDYVPAYRRLLNSLSAVEWSKDTKGTATESVYNLYSGVNDLSIENQ